MDIDHNQTDLEEECERLEREADQDLETGFASIDRPSEYIDMRLEVAKLAGELGQTERQYDNKVKAARKLRQLADCKRYGRDDLSQEFDLESASQSFRHFLQAGQIAEANADYNRAYNAYMAAGDVASQAAKHSKCPQRPYIFDKAGDGYRKAMVIACEAEDRGKERLAEEEFDSILKN